MDGMGLFLGESSRFFVFVFGFPMDFFPFENVHIEPICSMHVIFTHMWHKFVLNVGKCSIHGAFGIMYTWNPNVPCFDWKRPSFGGKTKDKWVPGIYIYIYISIQFYFAEIWAIFGANACEKPLQLQVFVVFPEHLLTLRLLSLSSCHLYLSAWQAAWSLHHQSLTRAISFIEFYRSVWVRGKISQNWDWTCGNESRHIFFQEPSFVSWRHSENTKSTHELLARWWFADFLGNFRTPWAPMTNPWDDC